MKWFLKNNRVKYDQLRQSTSLSPLTCLLLANRGISPEQAASFLEPSEEQLYSPFLFQEMENAVETLLLCLESETPIRIVGDYDQDGVASTAILMKGIRAAARIIGTDPQTAVSYAIPSRVDDGYGIQPSHVQEALQDEVGLLITVDNGIAAFEALEEAEMLQIPVIVTDHHEPVYEEGVFHRPPCDALINPHVQGETYPFEKLCGAAVAFKLIQALSLRLNQPIPEMDELLGFAALATICDMMDLEGENRAIVSLGLKALNESKNPGLQALLQELHWNQTIDSYTCGFLIGPCINSSGRLMTARLGVELFIDSSSENVTLYAQELVRLNNERKKMTMDGVEQALEQIRQKPLGSLIVEYLPDVHESLCGLIAGRVKEEFHRPTLIFTDAHSEGEALLKGSGRSIEAYPMFESLNRHRDQYVAFGGHAMACGMTIRKKDFDSLRTLWNQESSLSASDFEPLLEADGQVAFERITKESMDQLALFEPFGKGNPQPLFAAKHCQLLMLRLVGANRNVLQAILMHGGVRRKAVAFRGDRLVESLMEQDPDEKAVRPLLMGEQPTVYVDILYVPEWNVYQGRMTLQLKITDIRLSRV